MVSVLGKADGRWKLPGSSRLWMVRGGLFHTLEFQRLNNCLLFGAFQEPENLYPRSVLESFGGIRIPWYLLTTCSDHWWDHEALWWICLVNTKCYQKNRIGKYCLTVTHKAETDLLNEGRASTVHQGVNYSSLPNLARHATHSSETLDVATESFSQYHRPAWRILPIRMVMPRIRQCDITPNKTASRLSDAGPAKPENSLESEWVKTAQWNRLGLSLSIKLS